MVRGAQLAEDGGHPGFTQDGEGHAGRGDGRCAQDGRYFLLDALGQAATTLRLETVALVIGGGAADLGDGQADEDVGAHAVGLLGLGGPVEVVEGDGLGTGLGQRPHHGIGEGVEAAGVAHNHPTTVERAGRLAHVLPLVHGRHRDRVLVADSYPAQDGQSGGPAHGVACEPGVALELEDGPLGVFAEDAVDPPGVEAEGAQTALELGHVVTPQRGRGVIQQPVAQLVAGLDQRPPGLGPADAVDPQAPSLLERADAGLGAGSVDAGPIRAGLVAGGTQPGLEIPDRLARCPLPEQGLEAAGYRNSASSWTSWPFPLAPIMRFLATPSWKSTSVGMLMIS